MSDKNETKNGVKTELWNEVPEELLGRVICESPQEQLLAITRVKIPGFRPGRIPAEIVKQRVLRQYEKLPGVRQDFREAVEYNLEVIRRDLKKVRISRLPEKLTELAEEYCLTKVFLAAFLDERKGMRKMTRELWEEQDIAGAPAKADTLETAGEKAETAGTTGAAGDGTTAKLQKALNRAEKKLTEKREQHRKIVSARDKKIYEQRLRIKELETAARVKDREVQDLRHRLLEEKKHISKLEGMFSAMSGELRKMKQLKENDKFTIRELQNELEQLKKGVQPEEIIEESIIQKELPVDNDFPSGEQESAQEDYFSVTGEFRYNAPDGWVVSDQGVMNVPEELVAKYSLVTGDEVEIKMNGNRHNSLAVTVLRKVETRELAGFVVYEEDYWVKCGAEIIPVGADEVFRMGASEGDPVSVLIPASKSGVKGRITKLHRVSLVRNVSSEPARTKKSDKAVKRPVLDNNLAGVKVLVIGGDSLKNSYIRELQQTGAEVDWHTGFNELHVIPHKVGRADVVLVLTAHISHKAYYVLKAAARATDKKSLYYNEPGIRGAVKAVAGFCHRHRGLEMIS